MSFDADTLFGKIKRVEKELDILRSQSRTDFSGSGGGSGGGFGVGGSTVTTPSVHATFALNPVVHRLDEDNSNVLTGTITLRGASVIVEEGENNASTSLEFHTINGTLNDGQILTIKPKEGKTLTLKTGGNMDISSDHTITDSEFAILQYFEDNGNKYNLLIGSSTTGFANLTLSNLTSPTAVNVDLLPAGDETEDLGHTSNVWRGLYVKDIYSTGSIKTESTDDELEFYTGGGKRLGVSVSATAPFNGVTELFGVRADYKTMSTTVGANGTEIGGIHFDGYDSAVSRETFASMTAVTTTVTDGSEDGLLKLKVKRSGTTKEMFEVNTMGIRLPTASLATPSTDGSIYLSGTDVKVRTGGSTVNLSNTVDILPLSNTFTGTVNSFTNASGTFSANVPTVNLGSGTGSVNIIGTSTSVSGGRLQLNGNSIYWDTGLTYGMTGGSSAGGMDFQIPSTSGHGFDFQLGTGVSGNPQMGIANTEVGLNVPLDMNLNHIKFQDISAPSSPTGLEKRFLFSDTSNNDELSVKLPNGTVVSLEGGGSMSFVGFQADAELDMNGHYIDHIEYLQFETTSGTSPKIDTSADSSVMMFNVNGRESMKLSEASGDPTLEVIGFPSPELKLRSTDATPSDGQVIGGVYFDGFDSAVTSLVTYGSLKFITADVTNGTTDGQFRMSMMKNGSATDILDFKNTELDPNSAGVYSLGTSANRFNHTYTRYVTDVELVNFTTSPNQYILSNSSGLNYYADTGESHIFNVAGSTRLDVTTSDIGATVPLDMGSNKITSVLDPTSAQDVATKNYVDNNSGSSGANTSLSNLSGVSINSDMIPDISSARNLGGSTKWWGSGFLSSALYLGSSTSKKIQSSGNDIIISTVSGGDVKIQENGTDFVVFDGGTNEIIFNRGVEFNQDALMDGGNVFRSHDSTEIGFMVTNSTVSTGTEGTVQIPWLSGFSGTGSNADTDFGGARGCIGIMESGGTPYLVIRNNSGWWYMLTPSRIY